MNTWQRTSLAAGALVLAGSLAWGGIAYAQTATPTDDATPQIQQMPGARSNGIFGLMQRFGGENGGRFGGRMGRGGDGPLHEERDAVLAEALGMTAEELQAALASGQTPLEIAEAQGMDQSEFQAAIKAAAEKQLAAAVEAGTITQEQADAMLERMGEGGPLFGKGPGGRHGGPMGGLRGEVFGERDALLAEALDMTIEEFQAALDAGQTPLEIAEAQGMDQSEFQAAIKAAAEKQLAAAVEAGTITQEQADAMLERMADGGPLFGKGPGGRHGDRHGGPRGGHHRGQRGGERYDQPNNSSNWQPQSPLNDPTGQEA